MPNGQAHGSTGMACAAANSRWLGRGGCSNRSRMRRLSRSDNSTRSARSMTAWAAGKTVRNTKWLTSMCSNVAALTIAAFSSGRIRSCNRLRVSDGIHLWVGSYSGRWEPSLTSSCFPNQRKIGFRVEPDFHFLGHGKNGLVIITFPSMVCPCVCLNHRRGRKGQYCYRQIGTAHRALASSLSAIGLPCQFTCTFDSLL